MSLRFLIKLAALASTCWLSVSQAMAENRIALVIGNSNYTAVAALPNPANDAKTMATFLTSAGFEVVQAPDLTQSDLRRTIGNFARSAAAKGPDTACRSTARTSSFRSTRKSSGKRTCRSRPCGSPTS